MLGMREMEWWSFGVLRVKGQGSRLTWEKAGGSRENGPAFPTSRPLQPGFSHLFRRKWLISRIWRI